MAGEVVQALERWKRLRIEGWDVTVLAAVDDSELVAIGCRLTLAEAMR